MIDRPYHDDILDDQRLSKEAKDVIRQLRTRLALTCSDGATQSPGEYDRAEIASTVRTQIRATAIRYRRHLKTAAIIVLISILAPTAYGLLSTSEELNRTSEQLATTTATLAQEQARNRIAREPESVLITDAATEAILVSKGGHMLRRWRGKKPDAIDAILFDRDPEAREAQVAVAFGSNEAELPGTLAVYSSHDDWKTPIWAATLHDDEIPADLLNRSDRKYSGSQFNPRFVQSAEVFNESPGLEILTVFQHGPNSQCSIRIYSESGSLLWQAWHDGNITDLHWMEDPGLLVCTGVNGEAYVEERGFPEIEKRHPRVLFAISPTIGATAPRWIDTPDHQGGLTPAWYLCLREFPEVDFVSEVRLETPEPGHGSSPGATVATSLIFSTRWGEGGLKLFLDANGSPLPITPEETDFYSRGVRLGELPEASRFRWGEFPAITNPVAIPWLPDTPRDNEQDD